MVYIQKFYHYLSSMSRKIQKEMKKITLIGVGSAFVYVLPF